MYSLHYATINGHVEVVEQLIQSGADINAQDIYGWTPLHGAAYNGHIQVCELLLHYNADIGIKNKGGKTATDVAKTIEIKNMILIQKRNLTMQPSVSTICSSNSITQEQNKTSDVLQNKQKEEQTMIAQLENIVQSFDTSIYFESVEDIGKWMIQREKQQRCIIRELEQKIKRLKNKNTKLKQVNQNEIIEWKGVEDVTKGKLIGRSQFDVYKLNNENTVGKVIALNPMREEDYKQAKNEMEVMNQLFKQEIPAPIVRIKAYSLDEEKGLFILYSDYYEHGSLSSMLHSKSLSEQYCNNWKQKYEWIDSCCNALHYLHSKNVLHKDVKPENYLIKDLQERVVHITDFGISKIKLVSTTYTTTTSGNSGSIAGTAQYIPPELYSAKFKNLSDKQDIYSLGIVMWEICHLQKPFEGCNPVTIMGTVLNDEYPLDFDESIPNKWQELIKWCWKKKPEERPSILEVICYLQKHKMELVDSVK